MKMESIIKEYASIFDEVFKSNFTDDELLSLAFKQYPQWDSLTQMILIQEIEARFGVKFDFADMMSFTSYKSGLELITKKLDL